MLWLTNGLLQSGSFSFFNGSFFHENVKKKTTKPNTHLGVPLGSGALKRQH